MRWHWQHPCNICSIAHLMTCFFALAILAGWWGTPTSFMPLCFTAAQLSSTKANPSARRTRGLSGGLFHADYRYGHCGGLRHGHGLAGRAPGRRVSAGGRSRLPGDAGGRVSSFPSAPQGTERTGAQQTHARNGVALRAGGARTRGHGPLVERREFGFRLEL